MEPQGDVKKIDHEIRWPCRVGPKVPDFKGLVKQCPPANIDSSLASLRRELSALQMQDRVLHKQLLAMYNSIRELKVNLEEKQRWEEEMQRQDFEETASPAVGTKVEIFPRPLRSTSREIRHAKQDSGILTDEEEDSNGEEQDDVFPGDLSISPLRRNTFAGTASYKSEFVIKNRSSIEKPSKAGLQWPLSPPQSANDRIFKSQGTLRSHSFSDGKLSRRFGSMPVVSETSKKVQKFTFTHGKTFAFCGFRKTNENTLNSTVESEQQLMRINHALRPLSRHQSMPVINEVGTRPRSNTEPLIRLSGGRDNDTLHFQTTLRRAASSLDLSYRHNERKEKQMEPYKIYRAVSQISLV